MGIKEGKIGLSVKSLLHVTLKRKEEALTPSFL